VAVHRWPVEPKAPSAVAATAASMSPSSMRTSAFFPPISQVTFLCSRADSAITRFPTSLEPVNETALIAGWWTMDSPTAEPGPTTMLRTPGGSPAFSNSSTRMRAIPGVSSAGLKTTVLPATSAGAIFQHGIDQGKFQGVMSPATPSGLRIV